MTSKEMSRDRFCGFSLLEMAIVLAIIGMMTGYALKLGQDNKSDACRVETQAAMNRLPQILEQYAAVYNRLPRPAGRSFRSGDLAYGLEAVGAGDGAIDRVGGAHPILIGGLPFATFGLSADEGVDCWGNKLTYAVTQALTESVTRGEYLAAEGGIEMRSGTLASWVVREASGSYVVISHGHDALGASARNYAGTKKNCNMAQADGSITRIDKENCDTNNAVFYNAPFSDGSVQANFFDDLVIYGSHKIYDGAAPPDSSDCSGGIITWGPNDKCAAPALLTLAGISVPLTNINSGYTGTTLSFCHNGERTNLLPVCLPVGTCTGPSPRGGLPMILLSGLSMNFGTGVCKKYSCCNGYWAVSNISPCLSPLDLPGLASGC